MSAPTARGVTNVTEEMTFLGAKVPKDMAERVMRLAEQNDRTLSAEIRHALRGHLDRNGEKLSHSAEAEQ
jgi:predicted transcriptional regulator